MNEPQDPPANLELERACFGPVLLSERSKSVAMWSGVMERLKSPHAFFNTAHRVLAMVMWSEAAEGRPVDAIALYEACSHYSWADTTTLLRLLADSPIEVKKFGKYDKELNRDDSVLPNLSPILRDASMVGSAVGLHAAASAVFELYQRRRIIAAAHALAERLGKAVKRDGVVSLVDKHMADLSAMVYGHRQSKGIGAALHNALAEHDITNLAGDHRIASWGIQSLDDLAPIRPGNLVVIGGLPGSGKTSLALTAIEATAKLFKRPGTVGIVSREMTGEELSMILVQRQIGVARRTIERGFLTDAQRQQVKEIADEWTAQDYMTLQDGTNRCTVDDVCAWARQRHITTGGNLTLLVLDHILLLDPTNPRHEIVDRVSEITRKLKQLARDLKIAVIALSQLVRNKDQKGPKKFAIEPSMHELKGGGSIEQDADIVALLHVVDDRGSNRIVRVIIDKNRSGPKKKFDLLFDANHGQTFKQPDYQTGGTPPAAGGAQPPPVSPAVPAQKAAASEGHGNTRMYHEPKDDEDTLKDEGAADDERPF